MLVSFVKQYDYSIDNYVAYNKPLSITHWLQTTQVKVSFDTALGLFWHCTRSLLTLYLVSFDTVLGGRDHRGWSRLCLHQQTGLPCRRGVLYVFSLDRLCLYQQAGLPRRRGVLYVFSLYRLCLHQQAGLFRPQGQCLLLGGLCSLWTDYCVFSLDRMCSL